MPTAPAKPLVYLETSFISYLAAPVSSDEMVARRQAATHKWWEEERPKYEVFISDIVLTWNCRHIANPVTLPKTVETIAMAGHHCPALATPAQLLEARNERPLA